MNMDRTVFQKVIELEKETSDLLNDSETTHGLRRVLRKTLKELELYKNHAIGVKNWGKNRTGADSKRVQIGGGVHYLKGFLNIDIVPPADLICDVREGLPLKDGSTDFIFTEHFLEHIDYPVSVKKIVKECFRILRKRGELIIGVPNTKLVVESYVKNDQSFYKKVLKVWYAHRDCLSHFNTYVDLLNYYFRDQDDSDKYSPHLWNYDFEKLDNLLRWAGFSSVGIWKPDITLINLERKWWTTYVTGTK